MGQGGSTSVEFCDNWSASDVSSRGRIKCKVSCSFTQYSEHEFSTHSESSVTCKVYTSVQEKIGFGLLPKSQTSGCRNHVLGDSEIAGSIGCFVSRDCVMLCRGGNRFFSGSYSAGDSFTITITINHGNLSFFVNGAKVGSDELKGMSFHGDYKLGVSMTSAGQQAEVFFGCPVSFKDIWSAGDVSQEMLSVKKSTNFTYFSEQIVDADNKYTITANVLRNCGNSVGLGTVPVDCQEMCRSNLVGMKSGSIGCLIKNGNIAVMVNGNAVFFADVNSGDPCVLTMTLDHGRVSFEFDGKSVDCDELKSIRLTNRFRIGVGLSAQGQVVEMRGDGSTTKVLSSSESDQPRLGDKNDLIEKLVELLADGMGSATSGPRWKDNMKSIDCDSADIVAVGVRKFTATLYTQCVVPAMGSESIDIRILNIRTGELMMVGVMDEDTENHSNHHLGATGMNNSLALTNRGDLLLRGSTRATGKGFGKGDLLTLSFNSGNLSIRVNGYEAVEELGGLSFKSNFRWAVSFTEQGQAVKIGGGDLSQAEQSFCLNKGVDNPSTDPSTFSFPQSPRSVTTTVASTLSSGGSSRRSYDVDIAGCFIDFNDIQYGGRSLGEGTFGKVYKGKWDGTDIAVKEMPWEDDDAQRREIAVGRSLTQPNIATILGWSKSDNNLLVVMPLFRKGSLLGKLSKVDKNESPRPSSGGPFGFNFTFGVALGLFRAIKYMASRKPNPVVHRDIKPANVLLDDRDQPMLTDFGTARSLEKTFATTNVGTPFYMAAEQARNEGATPKTDVQAVTLIIYEILCAPRPVRSSNNILALMNEISQGTVPPMHDVPVDVARILKPAFSANPHQRPTAADMISSLERVRTVFDTA